MTDAMTRPMVTAREAAEWGKWVDGVMPNTTPSAKHMVGTLLAERERTRRLLAWAQKALWDSPEHEDDVCSPVCDDENCVHQAIRTALKEVGHGG